MDVIIQDILDKYHTPDNYFLIKQEYRYTEEDTKKIIKEVLTILNRDKKIETIIK